MKAFRVTGNYADPRQRQPFSIEMAAEDEAAVRTSVEEIPADQVVNHVVKYQIGE